MIIRYPTGLYVRQIPQSPSDSGNVTFVISDEDPETSGTEFILLPYAEKVKKRYSKVYDDSQRRVSVGDLIYTITSIGNTVGEKSTKLFEVGQSLEFSDETSVDVGVDAVPSRMELQHNTNILDLKSLGLTDAEIDALVQSSVETKASLEQQLTRLQNVISDNKALVGELQKTINEAEKTMAAILLMPGGTDIYNKVKQTRDNAYNEQQIVISTINSSMTESVTIRNNIIAVSQLVR